MFKLKIWVREALFPNPTLPEQQTDTPVPPLGLIGVLDEYSKFEAISRWNDVGSWTLEIPSSSPQAKWLVRGRGIVVFREGSSEPIFSGPIRTLDKEWDASEGAPESLVKATGVDDNVLLAERLAWTDPTKDIHLASGKIHWDLDPTWQNVGELLRELLLQNSTAQADRWVSKFYISRETVDLLDDDTSRSTLLRFNQISDEIKKLTSVFGFRITCIWHPNPDLIGDAADGGPGPGILARIEPVEDLTDVIQFGPHLGNLKSYKYSESAPTATRAVLGAQHREYKVFSTKPTFDVSDNVNGWTEVVTDKEGPERYYAYLKNTLDDPEWWGDPEDTPEDMQHTLAWAARGLTAAEAAWGVTAERFLDESSIDWQWRQDPSKPTGYNIDPPAWSKQARQIKTAFEKFCVDNGPQGTVELEPIDTPDSKRIFQDYGHGDVVRAHIDGETWDEAVREISISATSDGGHKANPIVGTDGSSSTPYLYRQVKRLWDQVLDITSSEDLTIEDIPVPVPAFGFSRVVEEEV